jgi:hypothetical protein
LPAGVTAALPGTLTRIFALIAKMKLSSAMTDAIATDLGIIGSEATEKTVPKFSTEMLQGAGCQCVKLTFYKYNHMGVYIEGRRGTGILGVPRHRHRKPLHRRTPAARGRSARSARIPHALLGQRHAEWRLDRCGESDGQPVIPKQVGRTMSEE